MAAQVLDAPEARLRLNLKHEEMSPVEVLMRNPMKMIFALSVLFACFQVTAGWESERIERDLETNVGETLLVKNINGNIDIVGWDKGHIDLLVIKEAKSGRGYTAKEKLANLEVNIDRVSSGWEVYTVKNKSGWSKRMNNTRVSYELKVPHELLLDIRTTNGEVNVDDYEGDLRVGTTNGNLIAKSIRGSFEGGTTNGSIRVELLDYDGSDLKCTTTNGNVTLAVPGDIQADVTARTTNGTVKTDIPMEISGSISRNKLNGKLNGGGPQITLRTTNGSIRINEN